MAYDATDHLDVLIVGAGLSGIGAAWHLQDKCQGKTYTILEQRQTMGGTWDLFRYPGIRSDSDMYTLGYAFKPWKAAKAIADGPSILEYVKETARENGIDKHIRFGHRVISAEWSSQDALWTVTAMQGDKQVQLRARYLMMCSGYYRYEHGYTPDFPGRDRFKGTVIHPQLWPEDLDYTGKDVVVIGSGATAVTIVPEMAHKGAKHVTMLQRSPTYCVSRPSQDKVANFLKKILPANVAYAITRWKNVNLQQYFYKQARTKPEKTAAAITRLAQKQLGEDYDMAHFTPRYKPWDQRMCLVPDNDLFSSIRDGKASVVTDTIETFTETGIKLASGKELKADIVVTATGLDLLFLGGMKVSIDGRDVDMSKTLTYKGMMYSGVPNLVNVFGYTNASWTLKCDLTCEYFCRLINYNEAHGYLSATPQSSDPNPHMEPWLDFSSGYVQRTIDRFPKQGARLPWKLNQNYPADVKLLRGGPIDDDMMFAGKKAPAKAQQAAE